MGADKNKERDWIKTETWSEEGNEEKNDKEEKKEDWQKNNMKITATNGKRRMEQIM